MTTSAFLRRFEYMWYVHCVGVVVKKSQSNTRNERSNTIVAAGVECSSSRVNLVIFFALPRTLGLALCVIFGLVVSVFLGSVVWCFLKCRLHLAVFPHNTTIEGISWVVFSVYLTLTIAPNKKFGNCFDWRRYGKVTQLYYDYRKNAPQMQRCLLSLSLAKV